MEPRIQYAKTEDGVSVAYYTLGQGSPEVMTPLGAATPAQVLLRNEDARAFYEQRAQTRQVILYDARGLGLSQGGVSDLSLDAHVLDLEAVVAQCELEEFTLVGSYFFGPVAIAYAARHPGHVSHLVLWCSAARGLDLYHPDFEAHKAFAGANWELLSQAMVSSTADLGDAAAKESAKRFRDEYTSERWVSYVEDLRHLDASALVGQVGCPTLVLHRRDMSYPNMEAAGQLAAGVRGARLVVLEGSYLMPAVGDRMAVQRVIDDFLGVASHPVIKHSNHPQGTAVILFLDIADSTALTTKLGDAAYREQERELDASLRGAISDAGGTPVEGKVLGDGVMAVFTSARQAIDAAQRCRDLGNEAGLPLHLGIHAGDVVREGNNVHGGAVQVAARVQGASGPGEILVSATVRDLARTSAGVEFEDRGEHELKGIAEPQRLFVVQAEERS